MRLPLSPQPFGFIFFYAGTVRSDLLGDVGAARTAVGLGHQVPTTSEIKLVAQQTLSGPYSPKRPKMPMQTATQENTTAAIKDQQALSRQSML